FGLPTELDAWLLGDRGDAVLAAMALDKKRAAGTLTYISARTDLSHSCWARAAGASLEIRMSRIAATLFAACVSLTAGCADNQESLLVLYSPGLGDDCTVAPGGDTALSSGVLDVLFETPYLMSAVLLNNTPSQASNANNTGVVTNEIKLLRAEVKLDSPSAPDLFDGMDRNNYEFSVPLQTISMPPQTEQGLSVQVVPRVTSTALLGVLQGYDPGTRITIRANVEFVGSRSGNDVGRVGEVKSRDFSFPIEICEGCLLDCSGCPGRVCTPEILSMGVTVGPCGNAQDGPVVPTACAEE
ncbi:MAG: hypothetical protein IAG13_12060, partial [Deltaproteobacteria bacterium]|nr:hypothetical protein [Nannocystaceae bacterium]